MDSWYNINIIRIRFDHDRSCPGSYVSSRLPGKVLLPLLGKPLIIFLLDRLQSCESIDRLVLATSDHSSDDILVDTVHDAGYDVFRGPLDDVLKRFELCSSQYHASKVIRLTGDCPFLEPALIDEYQVL